MLAKGENKKNQDSKATEISENGRGLNLKELYDYLQIPDTIKELFYKNGKRSSAGLITRSIKKVYKHIPAISFSKSFQNEIKIFVVNNLSELQAHEDSQETKIIPQEALISLKDPRTRPVNLTNGQTTELLVPDFHSHVDFARPNQLSIF